MKKTAILTGATGGLGKALVRKLVQAGYQLVIPCRNLDKAEVLRTEIKLGFPAARLDFIPCDLANLESVAKCAQTILSRHPVIDVFIANAATLEMALSKTPQGIEKTFAVNHLSHFVLLSRLLPLLYVHSRVIFVSSGSALRANPKFIDDIGCDKRGYHFFQAYADSKLANIACARSFARLLMPRQIACTSIAPGLVATDIWPQKTVLQKMLVPLLKQLYFLPPSKGCLPIVDLALSLNHCEALGHFKGIEQKPPPARLDQHFEDKLWQLSLALGNEYLPDLPAMTELGQTI